MLYSEGAKCEKAQAVYDDVLCLGTLSSSLKDVHSILAGVYRSRRPFIYWGKIVDGLIGVS